MRGSRHLSFGYQPVLLPTANLIPTSAWAQGQSPGSGRSQSETHIPLATVSGTGRGQLKPQRRSANHAGASATHRALFPAGLRNLSGCKVWSHCGQGEPAWMWNQSGGKHETRASDVERLTGPGLKELL